jgi:hypothetical protein
LKSAVKNFLKPFWSGLAAFVFFAAIVGSAQATVVTTPTQAELEAAIANGGTVTFATGTNSTITLTNTLIISNSIAIDGGGTLITLSGASSSISGTNTNSMGVRVFFVTNNATLTLRNVTISGGSSTIGAGIFNSAGCTVNISNSVVTANLALGIAAQDGRDGKDLGDNGGSGGDGSIGKGGGVYNRGALNLQRCSIFANTASGSNGGDGGNGHDGSQFGGNGGDGGKGASGFGGGIYNEGIVTITNCAFQANIAAGGDGGAPGDGGAGGFPGYPGAGGKGAEGADAFGGGIYNETNGVVTINNSTFYTNVVAGGVGGHSGYDASGKAGGTAFGGGVYNLGSVTFTNCTLTENSGMGGNGGDTFGGNFNQGGNGGAARGGAIYNSQFATFVYCTIATNHVIGGTGGINPVFSDENGSKGSAQGGSIFNFTHKTVTLHNTILAKGPNGGIYSSGSSSATLIDEGYNIASDATLNFKPSSTHSTNNVNARLLPLGNNGGITPTMPLATNSPAIDGADTAIISSIDQRGTPRPQGLGNDIGAYEFTPTFSISGKITLGTNGLGGITINIGTNATATSATNGVYIFTGLLTGTYVVTPQSSDYTFSPSNQAVFVGGINPENPDGFNATNINFSAAAITNTPPLAPSATNGNFQFQVPGIPGKQYITQASTNLTNWINISTNVPGTNGFVQQTFTNIIAIPQQFFRILAIPTAPPPPPLP